jgi:hypothetical protein
MILYKRRQVLNFLTELRTLLAGILKEKNTLKRY